jgi:hypothetical protein
LAHFGQPRVYPNLNPSAAVPVDRDQIFSLNSFSEHYRMRRGKEHGQYVPNAKFTFVKLVSGETLMHQRFRHPVLAEGRPVLYAGEAHFNNGRLDWWSNGSGNYRPDPDHAAQAGLPMEQFFTHDQVLKGAHSNRRPAEAPKRPGLAAAAVPHAPGAVSPAGAPSSAGTGGKTGPLQAKVASTAPPVALARALRGPSLATAPRLLHAVRP